MAHEKNINAAPYLTKNPKLEYLLTQNDGDFLLSRTKLLILQYGTEQHFMRCLGSRTSLASLYVYDKSSPHIQGCKRQRCAAQTCRRTRTDRRYVVMVVRYPRIRKRPTQRRRIPAARIHEPCDVRWPHPPAGHRSGKRTAQGRPAVDEQYFL